MLKVTPMGILWVLIREKVSSMIYTLVPIASCSPEAGLFALTCIILCLVVLLASAFGSEAFYTTLIIGFILCTYQYSTFTTVVPENRVVVGTLVKTEIATESNGRYSTSSYTKATYEVEGGRQVVTTKNDYYPIRAVFYANQASANLCK